ncbi:MAG TPA: hypothetical protein VLE43_19840 [Candidatus Saccharimonadia bacterium]|nr:hypothetical protein [Candidatus Saccharimonadia bacterium]
MKAERCPHCNSMVLFANDHCPRCRKHRSAEAEVSKEQMRLVQMETRQRLAVQSQATGAGDAQNARLKRISLFSEIAGYLNTLTAILHFSFLGVIGGAMLVIGARLLRGGGAAVKVISIYLMLLAVIGAFWCILTLVAFLELGTAERWLIPALRLVALPLFVSVVVMCFRVVVQDPQKSILPPPVPGAAKPTRKAIQNPAPAMMPKGEQQDDKSGADATLRP